MHLTKHNEQKNNKLLGLFIFKRVVFLNHAAVLIFIIIIIVIKTMVNSKLNRKNNPGCKEFYDFLPLKAIRYLL